jgi:hypothetical protein
MNFREELLDISYRIVISIRTVYLFPFVISHFEAKVRNQEYKEETLHCYPLGCLRNRQADTPWINGYYPEE